MAQSFGSLQTVTCLDYSTIRSRLISELNCTTSKACAYEVKTFQGALFIYGSMDESQATPALLKVVSQANHPGREHALLILMNQATPESLRALKQIDASAFSEKAQKSLRALLNSPELFTPRAKPKTSREEFLKAFEGIVSGNWDKFFELWALESLNRLTEKR